MSSAVVGSRSDGVVVLSKSSKGDIDVRGGVVEDSFNLSYFVGLWGGLVKRSVSSFHLSHCIEDFVSDSSVDVFF